MHHLRVALSFFSRTRWQHWPNLAFYFLGWLVYRVSGVRMFRERRLRVDNLTVHADVEGQSGLVFLYEILMQRIYDSPALREANGIGVIFDAGANCGFYTLMATQRWPQARVSCFEPHPVTFTRLQQNIRGNGLEDRVTPVHAAVSSSSGRCSLEVSAASSMGVVTVSPAPVSGEGRAVEVPMVSLDDYAKTQAQYPDLIKIDVEGFEVEVLKGAPKCLDHARYVVLEVHSDQLAHDSLALLHEAKFHTTQKNALIFATK